EDGIRDRNVTGVQTCALPILAEQQKLPGLKSWGLTPANAFVGITMRRTTDQRILIRQNIRYEPKLRVSDEALARARKEHQKLFRSEERRVGKERRRRKAKDAS